MVEIQARMRQKAHDLNREQHRLSRATATGTSVVKWPAKAGPRENRYQMWMDKGS